MIKKLFGANAENDRVKVLYYYADNFWDFNSTEFHLPLKMLPPAPLNLFSVTVV